MLGLLLIRTTWQSTQFNNWEKLLEKSGARVTAPHSYLKGNKLKATHYSEERHVTENVYAAHR